MADLKGKSLIITGAASGIGRAAALMAAKRGARLILADIDGAGGEEVCAAIRKDSGEAQFIRTDVSHTEDVQAMVHLAVEKYGRLDLAFNNAGMTNANIPFLEMPDERFTKMQAVNTTSVFLCIKHEAHAMLATGGGAIVNTSSTAAVAALPNMADYAPAKAGVIALTKSAALELGRQGIRVNAVLPGPTRTKMLVEGFARVDGLEAFLSDRTPLGRIGDPSEVAAAALWLLSDEASFITGVALPADGGLTML